MPWIRVASFALVLLAVAVLVVPTPRQEDTASAVPGRSAAEPQSMRPSVNVLATALAPRTLQGEFDAYSAVAVSSQIEVRVAPTQDADLMMVLPSKTEHDQPQTLLIDKEIQVSGDTWYKVMLPVRPNGSTGWVNGQQVRVRGIPYELQINLTEKRLDVFHLGGLQVSYPIGIGRERYPTPGGTFYLMELLRPPDPGGPYGTYTYVLNGFSNVLKEFNGGNGALGIHGTDSDATIGQEVSHGCIRMHNNDIDVLAAMLPLGTPVRILA